MTITDQPTGPSPAEPIRYDALQMRERLAQALRLTQEYLGDDVLPRLEGWEWFDALQAYERYNAERAESGLISYARRELEMAGLFDEDSDYGGELGRHVMDLVEVFSAGGHSGGSAMMAIEIFNRLARYQPLGPLTSDPKEWMKVYNGGDGDDDPPVWQSLRNPEAFSNDGGANWYLLSERAEEAHRVEEERLETLDPLAVQRAAVDLVDNSAAEGTHYRTAHNDFWDALKVAVGR